ncbi:MAG: HlyC/CorC family transporter [Deltaproteobacteria bacterium]|nr:HlyC/CorC family transporter [Deltaproteobacteria bacterium]
MTGSLELDLFILGLALVFSGAFSSAETALTSLSETRTRRLIEEKARYSKSLNMWLERPNRVLTAILIGNNVVNTFTASAATLVAQSVFGEQALSIAVGLTTLALLVFGEITPKTFAKHNAEKLAPWTMTFLIRPVYLLCYPAVFLFATLSKVLVKWSGGKTSGERITEEDIADAIRLGHLQGAIERQESELLTSIFQFGDTLVKEVMVPRTAIHAISVDTDLDEILDQVREHGHTRVPVYQDSLDDIEGIFHAKELLQIIRTEEELKFKLRSFVRDPFFVPELMRIGDLLKEFQHRKTHMAVVVDEYGGTSGIVCLEDLLEEIVGEIQDEFDEKEEADFRRIDEDSYTSSGQAHVDELGEAMGIEFPEERDYETLGGFLISRWGQVPPVASRITFEGWLFVIKDGEARKVISVDIERIGALGKHVSKNKPGEKSDKSKGPRTPSPGRLLSLEKFKETRERGKS